MIQTQPNRMVITTPRGIVVVARRLYERLEAKMEPDDLGLLRSYEWWMQLSKLVVGISIAPSVQDQGEGCA